LSYPPKKVFQNRSISTFVFFNRAFVETIIEAARGELPEFPGIIRTAENKSHG